MRAHREQERCSASSFGDPASIRLHYSMLDSVADQVCGGVQGELLFEIFAMDLRGFGTDSEPLRDFFASRSLTD
jgi:hypothetical protein